MEPIIQIHIKALHGTLHYTKNGKTYKIPVEHTGDYKKGYLVFFNDIDPKISDSDQPILLGEIRRDLQVWAIEKDRPLCW